MIGTFKKWLRLKKKVIAITNKLNNLIFNNDTDLIRLKLSTMILTKTKK